MRRFIFIVVLCALAGCFDTIEGVMPPNDQLIFPVGIATVGDDSHLLVVNSNFDLQYNAGTLVAFDLSRLDPGGAGDYDPLTGVYTLGGGTLNDFCDATTAEFCTIDESSGIRTRETVRLGAFASDLNITPDGDRALIPVRGERAIMVVDLFQEGRILHCGESDDRTCDRAHRITSSSSVALPIEPYTVRTMVYEREVEGISVVETLGFATHRHGGQVSLFSVSRRFDGAEVVSDNRLIKVIGGVIEGASGIAVNPVRRDIYVSGQRASLPRIAVLNVLTDEAAGGSYLEDPWFSQRATIRLADALQDGTDARRIAVSSDGTTGFVIIQSPPSLLKLNLDRYEVSDMVSICPEASQVKLVDVPADRTELGITKTYAFVTCFLTAQVFIVDTDRMTTVIRRTGEGPQDIAFDNRRNIAYIANFSESTLSLIQASPPFAQIRVQNPQNPNDLRILRIGSPRLIKGH